MVYLDQTEVDRVMPYLAAAQIDDFRLYSATLEDLYLHYASHTG